MSSESPSAQDSSSKPLTHGHGGMAYESRQTVKFITAAAIGSAFVISCGLTLTATVFLLILITPILVLFTPILVPAVMAMLLMGVGFLFSGVCGVGAMGVLFWMYSYVMGKRPPGAHQLDFALHRIAEMAREMKGQLVHDKAHESTHYT